MSTVYIDKTTDRVGFAVCALEKFRSKFEGKARILVKPNLVSHEGYPTTTHPEMVTTVVRTLKDWGIEKIDVADGPAVDAFTFSRSIDNHPIRNAAIEAGANFFNLHSRRMITVKDDSGFKITISSILSDYDAIISLPVLKSHKITTMTGALKNQFGLTSKVDRVKMHSHLKDINRGIASVNSLVKVDLFIVDGVQTLTDFNEVRHGGKQVSLGYMLAGDDPVALDVVGLKVLSGVDQGLWGKSPDDVKHLSWAIRMKLGDSSPDEVELLGNSVAS